MHRVIRRRLHCLLRRWVRIKETPFMDRFKSAIIKYPPDSVLLMLICLISGGGDLITLDQVATTMPIAIFVGWCTVLIAGAFTCLVGIFWPNAPVGFLIEGAGRSMLWPASLAYALILYKYDGDLVGGTLIVLFAAVCWARAVYVRFVYTEWLDLLEKHK